MVSQFTCTDLKLCCHLNRQSCLTKFLPASARDCPATCLQKTDLFFPLTRISLQLNIAVGSSNSHHIFIKFL